MNAFACSTCGKNLSVVEWSASEPIRCPACGAIVPLAVKSPVPAVVDETQALPNSPLDVPPSDLSESPTHAPESRPDVTLDQFSGGRGSKLTDFLAPPKQDGELGRLGQYRILQILGHGGMGVVFKAEDPKLKRLVAIKAMLPALAASASSAQRFLREAEAMATVEHDHIVRVYQIDEDRGVPFLAMEFLKGESLDDRIKRPEPLKLEEILRIGREVAQGLEAAHANGLIHRDIKPVNIWLESSATRGSTSAGKPQAAPRVKILDFGLARAVSQDAGLTQQGAIVGTPAYMSPEQGRGETVDGRCDLFSLGVVLYRLCTGKMPFVGNDAVSTLLAVASNKPSPPAELSHGVPRPLSDLIMKLLEKIPAKRIASASDVVEQLQRLESTLPRMPATSAETVEMLRPHQRRRSTMPLLGGILLLLALIAAGATFFLPSGDGKPVGESKDLTKDQVAVAVAKAPADNYALEFNGQTDYVELPNLGIKPGQPVTIEARIVPAPQRVAKSSHTVAGWRFLSLNVHDEYGFQLIERGSKGHTGIAAEPTRPGFEAHVAVCCDGDSKIEFYLDGKWCKSWKKKDGLSEDLSNYSTLLLGALHSKGLQPRVNFFEGRIDEVRFSKVVRYKNDFTPQLRFEPDADTLALYHFDEGQGDVLKDATGHGQHGKIVGAKWVKPTFVPPARATDFALNFEHRSQVTVPGLVQKMVAGKEYTFEAYVKPRQVQYGSAASVLSAFGHCSLDLLPRNEGWSMTIFGGSWTRGVPAKLNERVHLAGVVTQNQMTIFVDGKLKEKLDWPIDKRRTPTADFFWIGGKGNVTYIGDIDEIRVSKNARYFADFVPAQRFETDADTLALYHCDEGQGDILKDGSGNNYHGKIEGAKWIKAPGLAGGGP